MQRQKEMICQNIKSCSLHDLFKQMIITKVGQMKEEETRNIYFNTCSITHVLHTDTIQIILKFCYPHSQLRSVCKLFNQLIDKNVAMAAKARKCAIEQEPFDADIHFDEKSNKVWIVDNNRNSLSPPEIQSGYHGPFDFQYAIQNCESGDKILVHNGVYHCKCPLDIDTMGNPDEIPINIDKNIQIIGIGSSVYIKDAVSNISVIDIGKQIPCNVYFENLIFEGADIDGSWSGFVDIYPESKVWINNCRFFPDNRSIFVDTNSELYAKDCLFNNCTSGIAISSFADKVNIIGCKFIGCGKQHEQIIVESSSCIEIEEVDVGRYVPEPHNDAVQLRCIGNVFKNNGGYPVAVRDQVPNYKLCMDRVVLKHNLLSGPNMYKIRIKPVVNSMNAIYRNDQIQGNEYI